MKYYLRRKKKFLKLSGTTRKKQRRVTIRTVRAKMRLTPVYSEEAIAEASREKQRRDRLKAAKSSRQDNDEFAEDSDDSFM